MEITKWNVFFSETNHVSKNPKVLTEHIRVNEHKEKDLKSPEITEIHITNKDISEDNVVIIKNYWIRLYEYKLWVEAFKNVEINPDSRVLLAYIQGMSVSDTSTEDYYEGVIIFKEAEKETSKELKLTGETTAQEIEDYIYSILHGQITPGSEKREAVFTIGEYGAILFHRTINSYLEIKGYVVQDTSFKSEEEESTKTQFIKYLMPNGISIKINIKEHQSNMKIDEITGFPVESTILKFEEII